MTNDQQRSNEAHEPKRGAVGSHPEICEISPWGSLCGEVDAELRARDRAVTDAQMKSEEQAR